MGYILPVTNYQYLQYAERDASVEYDPYDLSPVPKIHNDQQLGTMKQGRPSRKEKGIGRNEFQAISASKRRVGRTVIEKTLSELTGKGRHISEYV